MEDFRKLLGHGFSSYCETCRGSARRSMRRIKTTEERSELHAAWRNGPAYDKHKQYMYEYNLQASTGLTLEAFNELLAQQDNKCAICGLESESDRFGRLHVDHCHETNHIRGLLCHRCNTALGLLKDNPKLLLAAIDYLKRGGQLDMTLRMQR